MHPRHTLAPLGSVNPNRTLGFQTANDIRIVYLVATLIHLCIVLYQMAPKNLNATLPAKKSLTLSPER